MAYRHRSLVASDEEDEDGNLCEVESTSKRKSVPIGEVVYLPEDTSNFQPEVEETDQKPQFKANIQPKTASLKVKALDSLIKNPGDKEKSCDATQIKSKPSCETDKSKTTSSGNAIPKSSNLKAADQKSNAKTSPAKTSNVNILQSNHFKKAKYARQATPICDAIMKEYSKRQRLLKQKGNSAALELSDLPIQELLKKAKSQSTETNSSTSITTTKNTHSPNVITSSKGKEEQVNSDPLTVVKQEIIDIKPEVVYVPVTNSFEVKEENKKELVSSPKIDQTSRGKGRGRGQSRGRTPRSSQQRKRRYQLSDEEDDTDEDPDFNPSTEKMKTRRTTRSSRKTNYGSDTFDENFADSQEDSTPHSQEVNTPDTSINVKTQEVCTIPKDKAINVAERLKSLAEKIADVLTKEPSPNINIEAEKLLHTTQELIEMQKQTLQNSGKGSPLPVNNIEIKQEVADRPEHYKDTSQSLIEQTNTPLPTQSSEQQSLNIFNQLQKHQADLQKKLSESVSSNKEDWNTTNSMTSHIIISNPGNVISEPVSVQEKCTFIMDYFTSYQEVFDDYTVDHAIPTLSESVMFCVKELAECIKKTEKAETLKSKELKQQQINLAKQSYLEKIMSSGEKFFPWFNFVIDRITKSKTSRALITTLLLYIAGSVSIKIPKVGSHIHRLRRVLLFMSKAHRHYHPLVNEVLQAPNDVFDNEAKYIRHILKYFQVRKFMKIPSELLCNYPTDDLEEKRFQADLSVMDTAILTRIEPYGTAVDGPVENRINQNYSKQLGIPSTSSSSAKIDQSRLSSITAEFVEALRSERDGNTKRIEQKLDHILKVLSGNGECFGSSLSIPQNNLSKPQVKLEKGVTDVPNFNVRVNLGKRVPNIPTVKLNASSSQQTDPEWSMSSVASWNNQSDDKGVLLAQLLENDNTVLDSLFSSYLKSNKDNTTVRVKSEPMDTPESCIELAANSANQVFVSVKQEPNEEFLTESGISQPNVSDINEELLGDAVFQGSFTEEYNFTKAEQDFLDTDPFS